MNNYKKKFPWWGWLLGLILLPFLPIYFISVSKKLDKNKKIILSIGYIVTIAVLGTILKQPDVESIALKDANLYLDEEEKLNVTIKPKGADKEKVKCTSNNDNVEITGFTLKAKKVGTSKIVCRYMKSSDKEVKSNSISATVTLSEKQAKDKADKDAKEEAKRIEKEQKEAAEKAAEIEKNKNILNSSEQAQAKSNAKQLVESVLKSPSSADFPGGWLEPYEGWSMSKNNNLIVVSSYVDAENSFGATPRTAFTIHMQINDDGTWTAIYFVFGDDVVIG